MSYKGKGMDIVLESTTVSRNLERLVSQRAILKFLS